MRPHPSLRSQRVIVLAAGAAFFMVLAPGRSVMAQLPIQDGWAVGTYWGATNLDPNSTPPMLSTPLIPPNPHGLNVILFNTNTMAAGPCNQPPGYYLSDTYHGPGDNWRAANLGEVFGVELDRHNNIYVAASTIYGSNFLGHPAFGSSSGGVARSGAIRKIDRLTGLISDWVDVPNNTGQGLGNIAFDSWSQQMFVTNFGDGRIYAYRPNGTLSQTYDHGLFGLPQAGRPSVADTPGTGFTPLTRRVWGVAVHKRRLFYSTWREDMGVGRNSSQVANEIWSVGMNALGMLNLNTARLEFALPPYVDPSQGLQVWSNPVSDIDFAPLGDRMFVAERTRMTDVGLGTYADAHRARVLEYCFRRVGDSQDTYEWFAAPVDSFPIGVNSGTDGAGGVSVDIDGQPIMSGDAVGMGALGCPGQWVYGWQKSSGLGQSLSRLDADGDVTSPYNSKTLIGSVEVYNDPCYDWHQFNAVLSGSGVLPAAIYAVIRFDDGTGPRIVVGGDFSIIGGVPAQNIAAWNGSSWSPAGGGINGPVKAFAVHDFGTGPRLFIGGEFTMAGSVPARNIVHWTGAEFLPLADGLTGAAQTGGSVRALLIHDDGGGPALFAGGEITIASNGAGGWIGASGIAKWNGAAWSSAGSGLQAAGASPAIQVPGVVNSLVEFDDGTGADLYAAGIFDIAGPLVSSPGPNVARFDGSGWSFVGPSAPAWDAKLAVATLDGNHQLFAGGTVVMGMSGISSWDPVSGQWLPLPIPPVLMGQGTVTAMGEFDDGSGAALYFSGDFGVPGFHVILRWDGSSLTPVGGTDAAVHCIYADTAGQANDLWLGGAFSAAQIMNPPNPNLFGSLFALKPCCTAIDFTQQPVNTAAIVNTMATLSAVVTGQQNGAVLTYQWLKNGTAIPGASGTSLNGLTISHSFLVTTGDLWPNAEFQLVVKNGCRCAFSAKAVLGPPASSTSTGGPCPMSPPAVFGWVRPVLSSTPPVCKQTAILTVTSPSTPTGTAHVYFSLGPPMGPIMVPCLCPIYIDPVAFFYYGPIPISGGVGTKNVPIIDLPGFQVTIQAAVVPGGAGNCPPAVDVTNALHWVLGY